jgi:hypothetical protein
MLYGNVLTLNIVFVGYEKKVKWLFMSIFTMCKSYGQLSTCRNERNERKKGSDIDEEQ